MAVPTVVGSIDTLAAGTKLGPYEIVARIGAGGMGVVYRARDSQLGRDVAIKVLPPAFLADADRVARFAREARLLASLNHPRIASIYGLEGAEGARALVMELVGGQTLADRLLRGPLLLDDVLPIAKQIAEALEYAHERGIVHRDLKPANLKLAENDAVKILDFGLAKALTSDSAADPASSPSAGHMATEAGVLLGTAAYMAPEQAKGKAVDRRADIWAFGCVLYEMLTGEVAFRGDSISETLAALLTHEPDWSALPASTPPRIRSLLRRCLEKDPHRRLQSIGEARIALDDTLAGAADPAQGTAAAVPRWRRAAPWAIASLALVAALAVGAWAVSSGSGARATAESAMLQITLPTHPPLRFIGYPALSPSGRELAFIAASADGVPRVWVRSLGSLELRQVSGTESADGALFWSPDGRFVAFHAAGKLQKVDPSGGPPEPICDLDKLPVGGAWSKDGTIVIGQYLGALVSVPAAGGKPSALTILDVEHGDIAHVGPSFLPDGRHFIYSRATATDNQISVGSLDDKPEQQDSRRLVESQGAGAYIPAANGGTGLLLFERGRNNALMAQPFDAQRLALSGEPVRAVDTPVGIELDQLLVTAANGTLVYWSAGDTLRQLVWFDAQGKLLEAVDEAGPTLEFALSPDGSRVIETRVSPPSRNQSLWLRDLARGTSTRLDLGGSFDDNSAVWSPDGRRFAFASDRSGSLDLFAKSLGSSDETVTLLKSTGWKYPSSWSPDGRFLLYTSVVGETKQDLWVLPLDAAAQPTPLLRTAFAEFDGHFSPDGRWVAYVSDESGRAEIYVRPFLPAAPGESRGESGDKWLVSRGGGYGPRWSGSELYYIGLDGIVKVVAVSATPSFQTGEQRALFKAPTGQGNTLSWAPQANSQRFLFLVPRDQEVSAFTVISNWPATLKRR